ncbi:MAG TPA: ATP-binding protein [Gemmataceae bacterium]|jgi:signal transduction histidine kinase|nr:ATP-binding protein [Gemmataceae bacterium]
MLKRSLLVRIAGPTVLVSLLLLGLSIGAAVYLYKEQALSASDLGENVSSAQIAYDLEKKINNLSDILQQGKKPSSTRHEEVQKQLNKALDYADKDEEKTLVGQLTEVMERYFALWSPGVKPEPATLSQAQDILHQARQYCRELEEFNTQESQRAAAAHRKTVQGMIVGLICVGTMGSLAGLLLGYATARGLRQSIYHLSVRVQDAANKLGQDLPAVSVLEDGDLQHLHEQMRGVVQEIEQVVRDLQQREREILRAEQLAAVGQLATGVAHELRNPLTSIKLLVQTNREEAELRGTPAEDLVVIEKEIRRMERSLQNFLDFAKPPKPYRRRIDLTEVIDQTLALIGGRARKQHVEVRFLSRLAPVPVDADAEQVQQVLVNLTLNALDVMPRGGLLELEVAQVHAADGQPWVEVKVMDTGPGIAENMATRLFQPFVSSKETGLGLGLVISRRIADSHGGALEGGNRTGGGAYFALRLPQAAAPEPIFA